METQIDAWLTPWLAAHLALLALLLCVLAFFSASETALFSLGHLSIRKLKEEKHPRAEVLESLVGRPRRLIITILLGSELTNTAISIVVASALSLALASLPLGPAALALLSALVTTALLLVLGEMTPKTVAIQSPLPIALLVARPLALFARAVAPLRGAMRFLADGIFAVLPGGAEPSVGLLGREEAASLVTVGERGGVIEPAEKRLIQKVFGFGDTTADKIMTPRTDIVCVSVNLPTPQLLAEVKASEYSRLPVYKGRRENIVGIVYAKDLVRLLRSQEAQRTVAISDLMKAPYYVPTSKKAKDLFRELRARKLHIAIVVDEYGGVAGLVTMEDLLEELFGEISDEYDLDEEHLKILGEDTFLVSPRMPIAQFNEALAADLPPEPNRTVGGFVLDLFGHVPEPGARMDHGDLSFTVVRASGGRIEQIKVRRVLPGPEPPGETPAENRDA